jgi:hypothetical protein
VPVAAPTDLAAGPGSPDAPAVATTARPDEVPSLLGLPLADAEQRIREAGMSLHVERVPGHPIGRVLTQEPASHAPRPAAGVVKVTVTAGGDFAGESPPAPRVEVLRVSVPDLLDRTEPQARRILEDVGLRVRVEAALRGAAGRVVDQGPAAGEVVGKESEVTVWIAPGGARPPSAGPPASVPPPPAVGPPTPPPAVAAPAPGPCAPPAPVSPPAGTVIPKEKVVPLGFTWAPVDGADAYVLEVEEAGPSGWLANARKPVRSTAATIEIERLSPAPGDLRWRVRTVSRGREGNPCPWITLH